jgi:3-oxoacid CoA-transferase
LLTDRLAKKFVASYVGENKNFENQYLGGQLEFEISPQGTIAERLRCGGAGIPAFYTPTGADTMVETGDFIMKYKEGTSEAEILSKPKPTREFNGKKYVLEESIFGDVAIVKAWKGDKSGNLQYRMAARNFNANMATSAKYVVAEVEHVVENGELDPDHVHTPGIYVDAVVKSPFTGVKRIERLVLDDGENTLLTGKGGAVRGKIAARVAKELQEGWYVNLGIGIPTLVPSFVQEGVSITYQSENGVIGVGGYPKPGDEDADLINAGKETIKITPEASFMSSADSFAIVRGGHLDVTILGAMQVSKTADLANWIIPGKLVKGMGGAMDLAASDSMVIIAMEHTAKGKHKILDACTLPLTSKESVSCVVTEMGVFKWIDGVFTMVDMAHGVTVDQVKAATGCDFATLDSYEGY